jgi:hypothetical protein
MAATLGLVSPLQGMAPSGGRSAMRAAVTSVLATILVCCVMSYMARSAEVEGGISLSEVSTTATATAGAGARTTSLTGIISSAEQAMNALRHSVLSDNAKTTLPLKTDDLLKTAMEEQMKDSSKGRDSVGGRWEEAADHTRKSAISHALMDVAKATKQGHDLEHLANHVGGAHSHHPSRLAHLEEGKEEAAGDHSSKHSSAWAEAADHTSKSAISNALLDVAKAKKEKMQDPMARASHGDGGRKQAEQEEAADHTSKSAISNALKDIAKVTKESQGFAKNGGHSSKQQEAATDHDHGISKANMQLAAKLQDEMKRDGDRARSETLNGGRRQSKAVVDEAEDMDHGKVGPFLFPFFSLSVFFVTKTAAPPFSFSMIPSSWPLKPSQDRARHLCSAGVTDKHNFKSTS